MRHTAKIDILRTTPRVFGSGVIKYKDMTPQALESLLDGFEKARQLWGDGGKYFRTKAYDISNPDEHYEMRPFPKKCVAYRDIDPTRIIASEIRTMSKFDPAAAHIRRCYTCMMPVRTDQYHRCDPFQKTAMEEIRRRQAEVDRLFENDKAN